MKNLLFLIIILSLVLAGCEQTATADVPDDFEYEYLLEEFDQRISDIEESINKIEKSLGLTSLGREWPLTPSINERLNNIENKFSGSWSTKSIEDRISSIEDYLDLDSSRLWP